MAFRDGFTRDFGISVNKASDWNQKKPCARVSWIPAVMHAVWVILYYGYGGRLSWRERRRLARPRREFTYAEPPPVYVGGVDNGRVNRGGVDDHAGCA
ncbi:hypothetical protein VM1G_11733 [Cytospora mali]|uniref:Uncharacterized protein n=1 Tax=Cytospora mali TaxID=578113 RepID=A0A194W6K4_CYTMA|nr:hypothetical protein VM1G_11733 [Valsa mali]